MLLCFCSYSLLWQTYDTCLCRRAELRTLLVNQSIKLIFPPICIRSPYTSTLQIIVSSGHRAYVDVLHQQSRVSSCQLEVHRSFSGKLHGLRREYSQFQLSHLYNAIDKRKGVSEYHGGGILYKGLNMRGVLFLFATNHGTGVIGGGIRQELK